MAKRKKATGKTKAKRKKTRAKAATCKNTTTVRKTRPIAKKTTGKPSLQGASTSESQADRGVADGRHPVLCGVDRRYSMSRIGVQYISTNRSKKAPA